MWDAAVSPKSQAASLDDFGDFEEAEQVIAHQPDTELAAALATQKLDDSALPPAECKETAPGDAQARAAAEVELPEALVESKAVAAASIFRDLEDGNDGEVPWYIDPESFRSSREDESLPVHPIWDGQQNGFTSAKGSVDASARALALARDEGGAGDSWAESSPGFGGLYDGSAGSYPLPLSRQPAEQGLLGIQPHSWQADDSSAGVQKNCTYMDVWTQLMQVSQLSGKPVWFLFPLFCGDFLVCVDEGFSLVFGCYFISSFNRQVLRHDFQR